MSTCDASTKNITLPITWKTAKGCFVWDDKGKEYVDLTSGIFVTNTGHGAVSEAIKKQANQLIYSYAFPNEIKTRCVEKLLEISPKNFDSVFLLSSGTEAVECAIKIMRSYALKKNIEKCHIVSIAGAMHGKTGISENLRGLTEHNKWADFRYFDERKLEWHNDFIVLNYPGQNDIPNNFEMLLDFALPKEERQKICGFMIETYEGWSGRFLPVNFVKDLMNFAKRIEVLVCFDEIQAGFGRTGKLFGYQHYGIDPDLITIGKGMGGGVPISGVLGKAEYFESCDDLSSTHSGNALCCAATLENINVLMKNKLIKHSKKLGETVLEPFLEYLKRSFPKLISEVNSVGLMGAIIFRDKDIASKVCWECGERGVLLVYTKKESIKIGPPLIITSFLLKKALSTIYSVTEEIAKNG